MRKKIADAGLLRHVPEDYGPRKMAFRGGAVHKRQPPGAYTFKPAGHSIAIMLEASPAMGLAFNGEAYRTVDVLAGMLAFGPAGVECKTDWSAESESIVVSISREDMAELSGHEFKRTDIELEPVHFTPDNTAFQLARMIRTELARPAQSSELYLDSLITMLGVHVLRNYAGTDKSEKTARKGGLSVAVTGIIREYLDQHFRRKLTTAELAGICGLSPSRFTYAFAQTFGQTPHQYLLERRLDFAEKLLTDTKMPVAEIAFLSGFSSQSHLTSTMRTYRHKTPRQFREYAIFDMGRDGSVRAAEEAGKLTV